MMEVQHWYLPPLPSPDGLYRRAGNAERICESVAQCAALIAPYGSARTVQRCMLQSGFSPACRTTLPHFSVQPHRGAPPLTPILSPPPLGSNPFIWLVHRCPPMHRNKGLHLFYRVGPLVGFAVFSQANSIKLVHPSFCDNSDYSKRLADW
jgi:hypothetical protein